MADLGPLLPFFILLVTGFLLILYEVYSGQPERDWAAQFSVVGLLVAGWFVFRQLGAPPQDLFANEALVPLRLDDLGRVATLITIAAAVLTCLVSPAYARGAGHANGEYYALIVFAVAGMMVMVLASDLMTFFLGLETMSIGVYCLTAMRANDRRSSEAALKYLLMGAFATGFLLFGIALIYGATGSVSYAELASSISSPQGIAELPILPLGIVLVLIGFGFKVAAVPFHMWAPDVYEGAPTPVTGFMAVAVKAAAFVALLRLVLFGLPGTENPSDMAWVTLLSWLAVLTILVGNFMALAQPTIKRMLAYSSVSHAGYILIGVVAAARGEPSAGPSILFYLSGYTFMTLGAFAVLTYLEPQGSERYGAYAGMGYRYPAVGVAMTLFMVALGGLPPTAGFFGKLYIFTSAIRAGETWLAFVGIAGSIVSIVYYLRVVVAFYMREVPEPGPTPEGRGTGSLTVGLVLAVIGVLVLGVLPGGWLAITESAASGIR